MILFVGSISTWGRVAEHHNAFLRADDYPFHPDADNYLKNKMRVFGIHNPLSIKDFVEKVLKTSVYENIDILQAFFTTRQLFNQIKLAEQTNSEGLENLVYFITISEDDENQEIPYAMIAGKIPIREAFACAYFKLWTRLSANASNQSSFPLNLPSSFFLTHPNAKKSPTPPPQNMPNCSYVCHQMEKYCSINRRGFPENLDIDKLLEENEAMEDITKRISAILNGLPWEGFHSIYQSCCKNDEDNDLLEDQCNCCVIL